MSDHRVILGDCRTLLAAMEPESIDACVTDPPYHLTTGKRGGTGLASENLNNPAGRSRATTGFMGKTWDGGDVAQDPATWAAVMRVLKPGGHLLAFGGTRTYHRMACAIEDAGFEVRDSLHWIYGSGFPKSLNLGDGYGTALKPAHEPIIMARKPLVGTVAANVERFGTGAINVDGCRVGPPEDKRAAGTKTYAPHKLAGGMNGDGVLQSAPHDGLGRWPPNVLLDESAAAELDRQSGELTSGDWSGHRNAPKTSRVFGAFDGEPERPRAGDTGGASRFFPVFRYEPKPARAERDKGLRLHAPRTAGEATDRGDGTAGLASPRAGAGRTGGARNFHPTVKPVALMRWLVRLVTPPGGTVLDPFLGSGTTACAAIAEGFAFVGCELDPEYAALAEARIAKYAAAGHQPDLFAEGA